MQLVAIIVSLAITAVTIPVTVIAVRRMTAVIRTGGPAPGRTDDPVARSVNMLKETFVHTRMLQWTWVGILHWFAYAAFLLLSSAVAQAFFQLFDPEFVWPIIGHFFLYEWAGEALGLLGSLAIIPLIVYRQVKHPRRLGRQSRFFGSRQGQAYFVEAMVLLESSAILFIRGAEYNLLQAHGGEHAEKYANGFHFPIAQYFGALYPTGSDSIGTLENIIFFIAMVKVSSAMIWLLVIATNLTMGVAWHRFLAWPNIWFKREADGGTALGGLKPLYVRGEPLDLEKMEDLEEEDFEKLGVGKVEDFSWKGLLDFSTCTECGRCQSQCPAWNTEKPLSPKLLMMGLREHAYAKIPALSVPEDERTEEQTKELERPLIGDEDMYGVIDPDVLWSCTNCGACVQQCPVDIEHVDHIDDMRRFQVLVESNFPTELNNIFKGLERKGNPWGMNPKNRMDWAKDLDFEVKQVGADIESLDEVEWLFWVGCAGAFEDRAKKTTQAVAELLNTAGVEFAVLGDGETCTGDPARRAGNEIVFMQLAMENTEVFKEMKVKKVVSTCAHCFNTLKNEYAEFGVELEVVHHTQLLNRLVREGKLKPVAPQAAEPEKTITYHDPCFLGRHNQVYEAPRELLNVIPGAKFAEMPRNSERSFCCGAGGARMWMEETLGSRINVNRTQEAVATGADQIAVGCPFCRVMLSDGLTAQQAAGEAREEVEVLDVAQMLLAAVKRAEPTPEEEAVVEEAEAATAAAAAADSQETPAEAQDAEIQAESDAAVEAQAAGAEDGAQDDPTKGTPEENKAIAAESNIAVDDHGNAVSSSGDAGEAPGADEVEASTDSEPEPDPEPKAGDTTDPETESVPDEPEESDDTSSPTEDEPAPDADEPVEGDARDEEAEQADTDVQAKADEPTEDATSTDEDTSTDEEPVQIDSPPEPAKPATDDADDAADDAETDAHEKAADEESADVTDESQTPEPEPEPEAGDTTDPETESVPDEPEESDDTSSPTEDEPAPDADEPVEGDARDEEAEQAGTDVQAKADEPTDDDASTDEEPVQIDSPPEPARPATDDADDDAETDADDADEESADVTDASQAAEPEDDADDEKDADNEGDDDSTDSDDSTDEDEAQPETDTTGTDASPEAPDEVVAVEDAPNTEPESDDVAPLSEANPSGEELTQASLFDDHDEDPTS